jgi:polyisoprenoid-binding protein YceI
MIVWAMDGTSKRGRRAGVKQEDPRRLPGRFRWVYTASAVGVRGATVMRTLGRFLVAWMVVAFTAGAVGAETLSTVTGRYRIEPDSRIAFHVEQLGGGGIDGVFPDFTGSVEFGGADLSASRVAITLAPTTVTAGEPRITDFLRSSAVFDADRHPEITFRSTRIVRRGPTDADIEGSLTARGKTLSATFHATLVEDSGRELMFRVVGRIARDPFGMGIGVPIYSNFADFEMLLRCARR